VHCPHKKNPRGRDRGAADAKWSEEWGGVNGSVVRCKIPAESGKEQSLAENEFDAF